MIGTIILIWFILGVIDTLIGNRILPGRVRVVQNTKNKYYSVNKVHRIMLIPFRMWLQYADTDRNILNFSINYSCKETFSYLERAIEAAEVYSNKIGKTNHLTNNELVWDSRTKREKKISKSKEDILLLVPQLIEAVEKDNKPLELEILSKMNNLTNKK